MHHHTIKINHQLDAKISPVYYLTFIYSWTCFRHPHAHHQELNNRSSSLCFYRWIVAIAVLLVVVGPARPRPTALLSPRAKGRTRGCYCSCWAPDDGREDTWNMLSCKQTSSNELEKLLHLVGDLFELNTNLYCDAYIQYRIKSYKTVWWWGMTVSIFLFL
jgi:hypothetical protein